MGYISSDYAFDRGVQLRFLTWLYDSAFELYPAVPDNMWRIIKGCAINFQKTSVIATMQIITQLIREPTTTSSLDIYNRFLEATMTTVAPTTIAPNNVQPGEHYVSVNTFGVNSVQTVGDGILMPPRAQIRTQNSLLVNASCAATFEILEATNIDRLKPYL